MAFTIPAHELEFRASRAGGPGGQHVNTSSTRIAVRWNVRSSPSLTEGQRERLLNKLATRIDSRGYIRAVSGARRSQLQNREAATERLNALVRAALTRRRPRKKTKPPASAAEQRLKSKRRRSELKKRRRSVTDDD